ncbi:hypothetical protein [Streptomyces sp. NPDC056632]|uniref:hypothetical protein n=1 Tax=Streptomyces sp. NPDC056632 TaxID=3345884 RepID=UPI003690720F
MTSADRNELHAPGPDALSAPRRSQHASGAAVIHCEAWAGTPDEPYMWLLSRDAAPTPWGAVRRLTAAAEHLADRLDDDPDDARPFPAATLRRWIDDRLGHEDIADRLTRRANVPEAVCVTGPGHVLYTLAAMPAAMCICRRPRPLSGETDSAVPALMGGWSA